MAFVKEDKFMYVAVQDNHDLTVSDVYLVSSPLDMAICKVLKDYFLKDKMAQDAPGEDLPDVIRYPNSKRRMNIFTPEEGDILMYEADAKTGDIAAFYNSHLKSAGWRMNPALDLKRIQKLSPDTKDVYVLLFEKEKQQLVIFLCPFPPVQQGEDPLKEIKVKRSVIMIAKNMDKIITTERK